MIPRHYIPELRWQLWVIGCTAIICVGIAFILFPLGDGIAMLSYDVPFLFRGPISNTNVVVVLEDRASLDSLGQNQWPPARTVHAMLLDRLREEGAGLVVFDILFRNEKPGEDEVLAAAIKRHGNVILGGIPETSTHVVGDQFGARLSELKPPTAILRTNAAGWGLLLAGSLDASFTVRKMTTSWKTTDTVIWLAAQRAGHLRAGEKQGDERWINFYGAPPAVDHVTLGEVLQIEGQRLPPGFLRGKTVFVGFDPSVTPASGSRDLFATPYTRFGHDFSPGVEVLANAYANLAAGDWLRRAGLPLQCLLTAAFGLVAVALLVLVGRRLKWLILAAVVLFAALTAATFHWQHHSGFWWNWLVPGMIELPMAILLALLCPRIRGSVFISYRREFDASTALWIQSELKAAGYDCFLDLKGLQGGEDWAARLLREVRRRKVFIPVLSEGTFQERLESDKFLPREIQAAIKSNRLIIPLIISPFDLGKYLNANRPSLPREYVDMLESLRQRHALFLGNSNAKQTIADLREALRPSVKSNMVSLGRHTT